MQNDKGELVQDKTFFRFATLSPKEIEAYDLL